MKAVVHVLVEEDRHNQAMQHRIDLRRDIQIALQRVTGIPVAQIGVTTRGINYREMSDGFPPVYAEVMASVSLNIEEVGAAVLAALGRSHYVTGYEQSADYSVVVISLPEASFRSR